MAHGRESRQRGRHPRASRCPGEAFFQALSRSLGLDGMGGGEVGRIGQSGCQWQESGDLVRPSVEGEARESQGERLFEASEWEPLGRHGMGGKHRSAHQT